MSNKAKKISQQQNTEVTIVNEQSVRDKIYVVRGIQVMLDFELAEIYGYTTKAFNQQVKNNIKKFDDDFRFQLTWDDVDELSRSKKLTLIKEGRGGNIKYLPWAFTESGIYMLMTVLKGDLATQQSKALIRTFRAMKDYIIQNQSLIEQHKYLRMLSFIKTENKAYDRFIVLDYDTTDERVFHCGPSSKDAGKKLSALTEFTEGAVKQSLHDVIAKMLGNPVLSLN